MSKITPGSNQLWEGSRIILPEHREAIERHRFEHNRRQKPELDEQRLEEFAYIIQESMQDNRKVKVIVFDEYEDREYKGAITKIDLNNRRIKLEFDDDFEWIKVDEIVDMFFV